MKFCRQCLIFFFSFLFFSVSLQEEIKITGVTVFVNPYTEPDEEDEQEKAKNETKAEEEDNVSFRSFDFGIMETFMLPLGVFFFKKNVFSFVSF